MAGEFRLADIGEGLTEAEIVRWLVQVGDEVAADQPMVEVETAKSVVDIPAPVGGVLLHQGGAAGDTLPVESLLAVIGDEDEVWEPGARSGTCGEGRTRGGGAHRRQAQRVGGDRDSHRPGMLPKVRRLAEQLGVDPAQVNGTGPGGRITEEDLRAPAGGGVAARPRGRPARSAG